MIILLDAGPLGLISNPKAIEIASECREWMRKQTARGVRFCLPEIVDYEVRRELLRGNKVRGLARPDLLKSSIWYLPITTPIMEKAAELWAMPASLGELTGIFDKSLCGSARAP